MNYKIIEVHVVYQENKIGELAVLWESNPEGWVRASYCNINPCIGYKFLSQDEQLTAKLVQEVAGEGVNLPATKKEKYFPGVRRWER